MWLRQSQWHGHVRGKRHRLNLRQQVATSACAPGLHSAHGHQLVFTSDERFWARGVCPELPA
eukprot:11221330-Lingulodinium_polyedra.AAC.1